VFKVKAEVVPVGVQSQLNTFAEGGVTNLYPANRERSLRGKNRLIGDFLGLYAQSATNSWKKGVGVAENPRSGVGARGSSVKKGRMYGKICYTLPSTALPLLNLLILEKNNREGR
jgi:hypothetical protein